MSKRKDFKTSLGRGATLYNFLNDLVIGLDTSIKSNVWQSVPSVYELDQDHLWTDFKPYSRYACLSTIITDIGNTYHSKLENPYSFSFARLFSLFCTRSCWALRGEVLYLNFSLRQVTVEIQVHSHLVLKQGASQQCTLWSTSHLHFVRPEYIASTVLFPCVFPGSCNLVLTKIRQTSKIICKFRKTGTYFLLYINHKHFI